MKGTSRKAEREKKEEQRKKKKEQSIGNHRQAGMPSMVERDEPI